MTGVSPLNGIPGDFVTISGTGFKLQPKASYSIQIAGVAPSFVVIQDSKRIFAYLPAGFDKGKVTVALGGTVLESPETVVRIASISLSPLAIVVPPGGSFLILVAAYDSSGSAIAAPSLTWGMINESCHGNLCEDNDAAKVRDGLVIGEIDVGDFTNGVRVSPPGTIVASGDVFAGNFALMATASVTVKTPN